MRTRDERSRDATLNRGGARSMAEAYCVKDKRKVEVVNPQKITMKNGKPALQGTCPICGGKVFKIGAHLVRPGTLRQWRERSYKPSQILINTLRSRTPTQ
jgi:hypothetical protein